MAYKYDFFISYTKSDSDWAVWVDGVLRRAGYSTLIQKHDFRAGVSFLAEMRRGVKQSRQVIMVLSPAYLKSAYANLEAEEALMEDPHQRKRKLIPIMVRKCEAATLFKRIVQIRLFGMSKSAARDVLLESLEPPRAPKDHPKGSRAIKRVAASLDVYSTVQSHFRALAMEHADCDKELFDVLSGFLQRRSRRSDIVKQALAFVAHDIQFTLDKLSDVLTAFTENQTAACIKSIVREPKKKVRLRDYHVRTEFRDTTSRIRRHKYDRRTFKVTANSVTEAIMVSGSNEWTCDNLKKLGGKYRNPQSDWRSRYNATIGVGIPAFLTHIAEPPFSSILCVDNRRGGLVNESCISYMQEVSWRLAVMLYRLQILKGMLARKAA